ncbi:hypothetical protein [Leifsonia sp. SIMBA_070]|uniref:hypothetical protein n=1 Tax=Leifsonia sp. SIMBA_070 TaxID=3085810 RepID=UPI003977EF08
MRRRTRRVTAASAAGLVAALALSGCTLNACPAIGYADTSPVALEFQGTLPPDATVSACFGSNCEPAAVRAGRDGSHRVPQRAPFLDSTTVQPATIRVVVATSAAVLHDAVHDIPVHSERTGLWGQCPGPWSYEPVEIQLG